MNQRVTSHRSLRASGLVLLGAVPLLASGAFAGSPDALTPDELRLLIATARERLPRYSLEYSVYAEGGLLGGKWVYAVAEPANPRSSVRLTVETPVPEELAAEAAAACAALTERSNRRARGSFERLRAADRDGPTPCGRVRSRRSCRFAGRIVGACCARLGKLGAARRPGVRDRRSASLDRWHAGSRGQRRSTSKRKQNHLTATWATPATTRQVT